MRSPQELLGQSISAMRALEKSALNKVAVGLGDFGSGSMPGGGPPAKPPGSQPIPPPSPVPAPAPAATSAGPMPYTGPNQSTVQQAQNLFTQNPGAQGPMGMGSMWSLLQRVFGMFRDRAGGGYGIGATYSTPATQAAQPGTGSNKPLPPAGPTPPAG